MKKNIYMLLLLVTTCSTCIHAQDYVRFSEISNVSTSIIRSYLNHPYSTVCYSINEDTGFIELRSEGNLTYRIPIPLEYEVKDMKVFQNLVYFCGTHKNQGFIGVANLNELYSPVVYLGNFYAYDAVSITDIDKSLVTSLEKMVVYGDENVPYSNNIANEHIVAIGKSGDLALYAEWVAVSIKYNNLALYYSSFGSSSNVDIKVYEDLSSPYNEKLQDVLLTDDYVSFVSYRYATDEYIIHRCNKYNIVGTFNNVYKCSAPQYEALSQIKSVAMDYNNIATASLAVDNNNPGQFELRIRNIDLSTMSMVHSQAVTILDQKQDVELAYNTQQKKIILMMYNQLYGYSTAYHSFIIVDQWPVYIDVIPNYPTPAIYDIVPTHYSSHYHSNGPYFIAASGNTWFRVILPFCSDFGQPFCYNTFFLISFQRENLVYREDNIDQYEHEDTKQAVKQHIAIETVYNNPGCRMDGQ